MSIDAFRELVWEPGWKYEYWDGCAHVTPREHAVRVTLDLATPGSSARTGLRPPTPADAPRLLSAYLRSFADNIEYCDWEPRAVRRHAREVICGYLQGKRGEPLLGASRIAPLRPGRSRSLAGAALVVASGEGRACLDLLFVIPSERRGGLASAMVAGAAEALRGAGYGTLESAYVLGNGASEAWHRRFGFQEETDLLTARLRLLHARQELERQERAGSLNRAERARLHAALDEHRAQVTRLEAEDRARFDRER
jgi:GNAT superfamily N-acetyltransferase